MRRGTSGNSYFSQSGYPMVGGNSRLPAERSPHAWVSLAVLVGGALLVATYLALWV